MEFLEEETRPRFLFQSRAPSSVDDGDSTISRRPTKPVLLISIFASVLLLVSAFFLFQSEPFQSLSLWLSISIILGPFAPLSITAGDIRVGLGEIVEFPSREDDSDEPVEDSKRRGGSNRRQKVKRSEDSGLYGSGLDPSDKSNGWISGSSVVQSNGLGVGSGKSGGNAAGKGNESLEMRNGGMAEVGEWNDEDFEQLKKQIAKHPVGKPRRWELIADAFKGKHSVQNVIKIAKSMGESKPEDSDSYSKFLKNRKPGVQNVGESAENGGDAGDGVWSSAQDVALLNALKVFPKEVSMRWEKVAAAVPGKSKAACAKRVADLKKDFRSSKSANS